MIWQVNFKKIKKDMDADLGLIHLYEFSNMIDNITTTVCI